ncbi:alpha-2-macroglobulin, partial [bacterium]|nr:alpha-2-macroglobulin [candidate division CSSED10-310 bacterium]
MKRSIFRMLCVAAAVTLAAVGFAGARQLDLAQRPADTGGTIIVPDHFLRSWDPVTIFFTRDYGPKNGGPLDTPGELVRLSPEHPGAYTWIDSRTLQFKPAEPWPPLMTFNWEVPGAGIRLTTLMDAPIETIPADGAEGVEEVASITLTFPAPVAEDGLARMASIHVKSLPGVGGEAETVLTGDDFTIKTMARASRSEPASYVLVLDVPIAMGSRAVVRLRLADDQDAWHEFSFTTAEPFRILSVGSSQAVYPITSGGISYTREQALRLWNGERVLEVTFSARPGEISPVEAGNLVRFDPPVENPRYEISGARLRIAGDFAWETVYHVMLTPTDIRDREGRSLRMSGISDLFFYFPPKESFLAGSAGYGVVECFGPQMIPLQGRGDEKLDLRIHKIDPLDVSLWPFPPHPVMVDESDRPPVPGEEADAHRQLNRGISEWELRDQLELLDVPLVSEIVSLPLRKDTGAADFGLDIKEYLEKISGKGAPGTYLVGIRRLNDANRAWMRMQVSDLSFTTIEEPRAVQFVVTSLDTGRPVSGARVLVEAYNYRTRGMVNAIDGFTDANGTYRWEHAGRKECYIRRIVVSKRGDMLVLDPNGAPDWFRDNQWFPTDDTWLQWTQSDASWRGEQSQRLCHLFTERPVYRPEDKVHIKGYVRDRYKGALSPLTGNGVLVVQGPGMVEWRYPVVLGEWGGFYHLFAEDKVPTGVFTAHFEDNRGMPMGHVSFRKEAYRIPLFKVDLHAGDKVPLDEEFEVKLTAAYYAGGVAAERPVQWRVTQFPYEWRPRGFEGFIYSSSARYSGDEPFAASARLDVTDVTDGGGAARLTLNPAVEPNALPRTYVVEATVTGADDQTVTAVRRIAALPPFVLGMKLPRYIERTGVVTPEILAVGPDDALIPGMPVTVRLFNRQWHSHLRAGDFSSGEARYVTDTVDVKVLEKTVETAAQPLAVPLDIDAAGVYIVEIEAHDRLGRAQVVKIDLYAGGDEPVAWSRPVTRTFQVSADKDSYEPGETAVLVLQSPFQSADVLTVVEAPEGNRYEWLAVRNGSATYRLEVKKTYVPRLPVHFILMRGRLQGTRPMPGATVDLGKPATLAATSWLKVEPIENRVNITVEHPDKARPGQTIDVTVSLADPRGRPLAGEVVLWLVDQAVLALGSEQRLDPVPDFISQVDTHTVVHDTRGMPFGYLPYAERPGGDGALGEAGAGLLGRVTVRRTFEPVPYYNPSIMVGADGTATVRITLPDNLTNFAVRAKAVSGPDRFGFATGLLAVRLPVIVQPALPRFVRPGDRFTASAIGRIVEGDGGPGSAEIQVAGLTLDGPATRSIQWKKDEPERIRFEVVAPSPEYTEEGALTHEEVLFRVAVMRDSDQAADAFEVKVPVRDDRRAVTERIMTEMAAGGEVELPPLAEAARPGTVRRTVLVSDQPALVRMAAGLQFLLEYPYGCTEQRLSAAGAQLAMRDFAEMLHLPVQRERVDHAVRSLLDYLPSTLTPEGLCAYWPGSRGYVSLTAWVVMFLVEAREAGYAVDDALIGGLERTLSQALRSDYGYFVAGADFIERCWALAAMARLGRFEPGYAAELARRAQYLNVESVALVLQSFAAGGTVGDADRGTIDTLVARMDEGIVTKLHQGREVYGGLQDDFAAQNELILPGEVRTLAQVVRALERVDGDRGR